MFVLFYFSPLLRIYSLILTVRTLPMVYSSFMTKVVPYQNASAYDAYIRKKAAPIEIFDVIAFFIPIRLASSKFL